MGPLAAVCSVQAEPAPQRRPLVNFARAPAAEPVPLGALPGVSGSLGEGTQLETPENGVLVRLSSNPGLDEHSFVRTHTPVLTTGPGIRAGGASEQQWLLLASVNP